jgi:hypothetical protein
MYYLINSKVPKYYVLIVGFAIDLVEESHKNNVKNAKNI